MQANLGRKLRVRSTAGTVFLPTNTTRSCFKKLLSTGQGPSGANLTNRGKMPNQVSGPIVVGQDIKRNKPSSGAKVPSGSK